MSVTVRPVSQTDKADWDTLYSAYAEFYHVEQTAEMRDRVWEWLFDKAEECEGLVAEKDGAVIGIAHFRPFARPLASARGLFLDDLFVSPSARGSGAADALIDEIRTEAKARGCTVIRWITAEDNYRARSVYDRMAERTAWVTYDVKVP